VLLTINYLSGFCPVVLYIPFYVQYNKKYNTCLKDDDDDDDNDDNNDEYDDYNNDDKDDEYTMCTVWCGYNGNDAFIKI